ncbi:GIDE domain-containing protein [Thiomonas sp.]
MLRGLSPSSAPLQLLLMGLALGAIGIVQFFRLQHRRRVMEDMPTARIRSAAQGYVELVGQALAPDLPLFSPITRTPCCWYRYKIERRDGSDGDKWTTEEQGASTAQFWLDDETGRCIIDPEGAEVRARTRSTWTGAAAQLIPGSRGEVMLAGDKDHRYTEHLILPGQTLYALGWFASLSPLQASKHEEVRERIAAWKADPQQRRAFDTNGDGELDMAEFEQLRQQAAATVEAERRERAVLPQTHVLKKPNDRRVFLLTTEPHDDLTRTLRWQAWGWLLAGVLGLGYGGAGLLMRF